MHPLEQYFFTTFGVGWSLRSAHSRKISPLLALIMWAYSPKIAKIGYFWYEFAPNGVYPLRDYWHSGCIPRSAPLRQILPLWL